MKINWDGLLAVFAVSLGATAGVVTLVAVALVGMSARAPHLVPVAAGRRPPSPRTGTAVAAVCLALAAAIVLFGLWTLVAG
jgi:hypothetical protein